MYGVQGPDLTKPKGMKEKTFAALKDASEDAKDAHQMEFYLAAGGVPKPIISSDDWFDVLAMSTYSGDKRDNKISTHYRTRSGDLKLKAKSKRQLGIF